ncbi:MAG: methyltransferase domain-containing protein [Gemmatimonadales bacterium]
MKVNLGCGTRCHPAWTNIDIDPQGPGVIPADLSKGIPLQDSSCSVVYHSAVLEHLRRSDARRFIGECFRILEPGGTMRVGVPDLEATCRSYLGILERAGSGDTSAQSDHEWITLELLDQSVREAAGGGMLGFLRQDPIPNEAFVYQRIGEEGRELVEMIRRQPRDQPVSSAPRMSRGVRHAISTIPATAREKLLRALLTPHDQRALDIGRFRLAGEVHQWMYDRYSLARLLTDGGFVDPVVHDAWSSSIPDWSTYHLDITSDGRVVKPDLFFMEARKPGQET